MFDEDVHIKRRRSLPRQILLLLHKISDFVHFTQGNGTMLHSSNKHHVIQLLIQESRIRRIVPVPTFLVTLPAVTLRSMIASLVLGPLEIIIKGFFIQMCAKEEKRSPYRNL